MISAQPWHDRARDLLATGLRVQQVADQVGKSDDMVRVALNINGAGDRFKARVERMKARRREVREAGPAVAPVLRTTGITLPRVTLPALEQDEDRRVRTFAPRVHFRREHPGVARWREHHERMLRSGRIAPQSDLVSEWRQ